MPSPPRSAPAPEWIDDALGVGIPTPSTSPARVGGLPQITNALVISNLTRPRLSDGGKRQKPGNHPVTNQGSF
jgi:hypothetical protein